MELGSKGKAVALSAVLLGTLAASQGQPLEATLSLDENSYIEVGNDPIMKLPPGGKIRFHFEEPGGRDNLSLRIAPDDFDIPPTTDPQTGDPVRYVLVQPAGGYIRSKDGELILAFTANVGDAHRSCDPAILCAESMRFTTEEVLLKDRRIRPPVDAAARGSRGSTGNLHVRLVSLGLHLHPRDRQRFVPVLVVLSGTFDRLPSLRD